MSTPSLSASSRTVLLATATYAAAFGAALLTGPGPGGLNAGVESVSSGAGTLLGSLAAALPLGYAFGAGMVAAVNPCGFALLPAYMAMYLGERAGDGSRSSLAVRLARAARIGLSVSAGFTALFGATGLLVGLAATALVRVFPWAGLAVGVLLIALGASLTSGRTLYTSLGERVADRLAGRTRRGDAAGYFAYGLAYGAASLSCTLPIFLAVVGSAFTAGDYLAAGSQFLLYALGMGAVVVGVTLGLAVFREGVATRAGRVMRYVQPASAALLLLAGAYIVYYWLTLGDLLPRLREL